MKLDDLFHDIHRMEPPENIKARIFAVARSEPRKERARWRFVAWPLAAAAAALVLAVGVARQPEPATTPAARVAATEREEPIEVFIAAALEEMFAPPANGEQVAQAEPDGGIDQFINQNLQEIFWINGGNHV